MEVTKVTTGPEIGKEIRIFLLRMNMSMNMEINSTIWTELHATEDHQEEKGVNLRIEIDLVHHFQEVMQLIPMRTNLKTKETIKITIQEETRDPQPKANTNQMRRKNCPVKSAKKQHIQTYSVVQN